VGDMSVSPEHTSVEMFVEYLIDDERETFDHNDLIFLGESTHRRRQVLRNELESYGFKLVKRESERVVRGFNANSNDRWCGPGSCRTYGGSGWEQISGFAGDKSREGT
jgi:hypothetical protein